MLVNGKKAGGFHLNADNYDVFHQLDVSGLGNAGREPGFNCHQRPGQRPLQDRQPLLAPLEGCSAAHDDVLGIEVGYDRTSLAKNDSATCNVAVTNLTKRIANQVMLDIGVPPGFDVNASDLETLVKKQTIQKFS